MTRLDPTFASARISAYLGLEPGGEDLLGAIRRIPSASVTALATALKPHRRVLVIGNGGSHGNARLVAALLRDAGVSAVAVGALETMFEAAVELGYDQIFVRGLEQAGASRGDAVIALSGSGNSPSVLRALEAIRFVGGAGFALGGRDGGAMVRLVEDRHSIVVPATVMETIEDLHVVVAHALAAELGAPRGARLDAIADVLDRTVRGQVAVVARLAAAIGETAFTGGRVLILGSTPMAEHWRQDLERGATCGLPLRGFHAPELLSAASVTATGNDDGFAAAYLKTLTKLKPGTDDVAVLLGRGVAVDAAARLLAEAGCPTWVLGSEQPHGVPIPPPADARLMDLAVSVVDHAVARTLNDWLTRQLDVRPIDLGDVVLPTGMRRPDRTGVLALEEALRREGRLEPDRVLMFSYGKAHTCRHPESIGLERAYY